MIVYNLVQNGDSDAHIRLAARTSQKYSNTSYKDIPAETD